MTTYTVASGDTLGTIARKFYGDANRFNLIVAANQITDPDKLAVGQTLVIPDAAVALVNPAAPVSIVPSNPTDSLSQKRLAQVHPGLATRGRAMIELCAHQGITILITQGLRTWEEQDALYAKGRTVAPIGPKYIVTKAKGGQSYHNFGLAFDIVVLDAVGKMDWDATHPAWKQAAVIGKSVGLEWGGDWQGFKDLPHFQFTSGISLADCRTMFPSGLPAIWAKVGGEGSVVSS